MTRNIYERGAEWRKWDLHVHSPASFHWKGKRFNHDSASRENADLVDEMIAALNSTEPAVFALMDYWTRAASIRAMRPAGVSRPEFHRKALPRGWQQYSICEAASA